MNFSCTENGIIYQNAENELCSTLNRWITINRGFLKCTPQVGNSQKLDICEVISLLDYTNK